MKSRVLSLLVLFLIAITSTALAGPVTRKATNNNVKPEFVPNMLIIKLKHQPVLMPGATATGVTTVDRVLQRIMTTGVEPLHASPSLKKSAMPEARSLARILIVRYNAPMDPVTLAKEVSTDPSVEYAEPMPFFRPIFTPNDPRLATQWAIGALKMAEAWDITKGDSTIVIGFVDTGINYGHEDLAQSIWINPGEWGTSGELRNNGIDDDGNGYTDDWRGWDFIGTGTAQAPIPDNDPLDFNGHGTGAASVAAARTNNGLGIAGIGYHTKVLPIKVQDDAGAGAMMGYPGITYAVDMGCKVINCSWGAQGYLNQTMQDIVDYAYANGALVVGGTGNTQYDVDLRPYLPANLLHVLSVSSHESNGTASTWASIGASADVFAPGTDVLAARTSFGYQTVTGTSYAGAMMSGLAALVFSVHPTWTPDQVMKQIRVTSDAFGATRTPDTYGRANAFKALSTNGTLTDIPGLMVTSTTVGTPAGNFFSQPGQTAQVTFELTNVLAPTSANASLTLSVKGGGGTIGNATQSIGALGTNAKKSITFSLTMDQNPPYSEGYMPVIVSITDGEYVDYEVVRIPVFLENSWHTSLPLRYPFNSIDVVDQWTVWVTGHYAPGGVPTQDIAVRSTDGGSNWVFASGPGFPSPKGVYCVEGISADRALIGTGPADGSAEIFRTEDGGATWAGTNVSAMTPFVNWIHMFDSDNGIFQGDPKNDLWAIGKTTNGGLIWTPVATPVSAPTAEAGWNNAYDFIGDTGWFGTNNSRIYKTTDRGETWTSYPTPSRHSVDISFRDLNVGLIRFSRNNDTGNDTLAVTQDGGATWTIINTIDVGYGTVFFERGGKRLWFLNEQNAYVSTDVGATWNVRPAPPGMDFVSDADTWTDGFLSVAFACGIEVYRFESPFEGVTSAPTSPRVPIGLAIDQVFPNPGNSSKDVTVRFTTPQSQPITLGLYDINGRLLHTIVNATVEQGTHNARIATSALAAGSYVVRLSTGTASVTTQLTIAR